MESPDTSLMLQTIVAAIAAGVASIIIARKLRLPSIVLLLIVGVALGPQWLNIVQPETLGHGLSVIIALAVGIILFEGGLTLDVNGYRSTSVIIRRLLTFGVLVTWWATALILHLVFDLSWAYSALAGSLVIVTGPTVIIPLLKRVRVNDKLHSILHWEGVLIDPIGVFVAVLCYEWVVEGGEQQALIDFVLRIGAGIGIGLAGGYIMSLLSRRKIVPDEMINVFALAGAVLLFGLAEQVRSETGLLTVTVAGFTLGLTGGPRLKQIKQFKAELTDLLIGLLFILLTARLSFEQFVSFGWRGAIVVAAVMLVVRPLNVFLCSFRTDLGMRERTFLAWVAPRGIIAATLASLIQINLDGLDSTVGIVKDARLIESFTYSVIIATIVLQGLSASMAAKVLRVGRPEPTGWLIIGATTFARRIAEFLSRDFGRHAIVVDTNTRAVRVTNNAGVRALAADGRDVDELSQRPELHAVGNLLALTDNEDLNDVLCRRWMDIFGSDHVFRFRSNTSQNVMNLKQTDDDSGSVVWPALPAPTLISAELEAGSARLVLAQTMPSTAEGRSTVLLRFVDDRVILDSNDNPNNSTNKTEDTDLSDTNEKNRLLTLYLVRRSKYLAAAANRKLIVTSHATDLSELFGELVNLVVQHYPAVDRDDTIGELLDSEATFPSALGHGIAAPHAHAAGLKQHICAIAQLPNGIDFDAADQELVLLVFLLISPAGDPEGHLAALAEIAELVSCSESRERLFQVESAEQLIRMIRDTNQPRY